MTSDERHQTEHPDLWLSETTTPGLLMQTDVNSGETEPAFAGAAAPTSVLAHLDQTLAPLKDIQAQSDMRALYTFIFVDEDIDDIERKRRLHLLADEMEKTAIHLRRIMFRARNQR